MKYLLLLITTGILSLQLSSRPYFYSKKSYLNLSSTPSKHFKKTNYLLYRSTITGNKKGLDRDIKKAMKLYGLSHLITPSGLHLGAILPFLIFPYSAQVLLLLLFLLWIRSFESYLSLERVTLFALLQRISRVLHFKLSTESLFLISMSLSLISGNADSSAGSYLYSLLFWGTIIIFRHNPIRAILYLNLSLHFISSLHGIKTPLISILINPIFSSVYVLSFPVMVLNALTGGIVTTETFLDIFLTCWSEALLYLASLDILNSQSIEFASLVIIILLAINRRWKLVLLFLCLDMRPLNLEPNYVKHFGKNIYNTNCKYQPIRLKCKKNAPKKERSLL